MAVVWPWKLFFRAKDLFWGRAIPPRSRGEGFWKNVPCQSCPQGKSSGGVGQALGCLSGYYQSFRPTRKITAGTCGEKFCACKSARGCLPASKGALLRRQRALDIFLVDLLWLQDRVVLVPGSWEMR